MYRLAVCDNELLLARQNGAMARHILEKNKLQNEIDFHIDIFIGSDMLCVKLLRQRDYYQLVLMDIELDGDNGMEVIKRIQRNQADCRLIYITAYRDYVFDSFETHPLQYLLKPVDEDKLAAALLYDYQTNYKPSQLLLRKGDTRIPIRVKDILYVESTQHKAAIHLNNCRTEFWNGSLTALQKELPPATFCRCHNSYLINLSYVSQIIRYEAMLKEGSRVPVSKQNYSRALISTYSL